MASGNTFGVSTEPHRPVKPGRASRTAQWIIVALILAVLVIAIFVLQNTATAHVHFLFWSTDVALAGAILLAAALGALVGFLVAFVRQLQYRRAMRREHDLHEATPPPPQPTV